MNTLQPKGSFSVRLVVSVDLGLKDFLLLDMGNIRFKFVFALLCLVLSVYSEESKDENKEKKKEEFKGTVVGIDLGTTYSVVGIFKEGRVEIIPNDQGNRITPSYVAFTETGERLIGDAAKNQLTSNPTNTIFDAKRSIWKRGIMTFNCFKVRVPTHVSGLLS